MLLPAAFVEVTRQPGAGEPVSAWKEAQEEDVFDIEIEQVGWQSSRAPFASRSCSSPPLAAKCLPSNYINLPSPAHFHRMPMWRSSPWTWAAASLRSLALPQQW